MADKETRTRTSKASGKTPGYRNYLSFGGGVNSVALYLLMEQLGMEFEAGMYASHTHFVDRFFPSTKLCANCAALHDMPLSKRVFECACGVKEDRDVHAAQNIIGKALAELTPLESEALAC